MLFESYEFAKTFEDLFTMMLFIEMTHIYDQMKIYKLTGEDSKLVHRRKRPKVDASIFFFFFPTRPSDE